MSSTTTNAEKDVVISKRLAFLTRHAPAEWANKMSTETTDGTRNARYPFLRVYKGGYIPLDNILRMGHMRQFTREDIMRVVGNSMSFINVNQQRFQVMEVRGTTYIRAVYGHSFNVDAIEEELPESGQELSGRAVPSLVSYCIESVVQNIKRFPSDFKLGEALPDQFLLQQLFEALKKEAQKGSGFTMSNPIIKMFLVPQMEVLDLRNIIVSSAILRTIGNNCNNLTSLNLHGCFTDMNDTNLQYILKRCGSKIVHLDLGECRYLTSAALDHIGKFCKELNSLVVCGIPALTDAGVLALATKLKQSLMYLDISDTGAANNNNNNNNNTSAITREGVIKLRKTFPNLKVKTTYIIRPHELGLSEDDTDIDAASTITH